MTRRPVQSFLAFALLAVSLGGCFWPVPGRDPNRSAHNEVESTITPDNVGSLRPAWSANLDGPAGAPVTSRYGLVVSGRRTTYSLAYESGDTQWSHSEAAPLSVTQPFVRSDKVLVGRLDETATASTATEGLDVTLRLNAETGAVEGSPTDGQLVALRGQFGLFWDLNYFPPRVNPPYWGVHLTVRDLDSGVRTCCNDNYNLHSASPPPPTPAPITLGSEFIFTSGNYMNDPQNPPGSFGNGVRGFSLEGPPACSPPYICPDWGVPLNGTTSTAPVLNSDQQVAYVGTDAGTVYAVDTETHSVIWSNSFVGTAVTASPALADGTLFVPTDVGHLLALDADTGALKWAGLVDSRITVQPAVAGGVVFAGAANGTVAAFDAAGCGGGFCSNIWSNSTGSSISGAPAVSVGRLYVGTADGRVLAFAL